MFNAAHKTAYKAAHKRWSAGCEEYGGELPDYDLSANGVMVLCKACPEYMRLLETAEATGGSAGNSEGKSEGNSEEKGREKSSATVNATVSDLIFDAIKNNPGISRPGLLWLLPMVKRGTLTRKLAELSDRIEFRGSPKTSGYYPKPAP